MLARGDLVKPRYDAAAIRAACVAQGPAVAATGSPSGPPDEQRDQFFAAVDVLDRNAVLDLYSLTGPAAPGARCRWWRFEGEGWVVLDHPWTGTGPAARLRWVPSPVVPTVVAQLISHHRRSQAARSAGRLRDLLERALSCHSTDGIRLGSGYVQWAGYPGGLLLEVGDGRDFALPLDEQLWSGLRWIGWRAPDEENRNAWFQAEGPDAVEVAADLVSRTLALLGEEPA
jgi:hypothetical protein